MIEFNYEGVGKYRKVMHGKRRGEKRYYENNEEDNNEFDEELVQHGAGNFRKQMPVKRPRIDSEEEQEDERNIRDVNVEDLCIIRRLRDKFNKRFNLFSSDHLVTLVGHIFKQVTVLNDTVDKDGVDPFSNGLITIASACSYVFARNFLKPDSIAIFPPSNFETIDNHSFMSMEWLSYESKRRGINIHHARNGGEKVFGPYKIDGASFDPNIIFEFMGCMFHGCKKCYRSDTKNPFTGVTMADSYLTTIKKSEFLKQNFPQFEYVEIWEHEWKELKRSLPPLYRQEILDVPYIHPTLNPRDAFFGGRTNAARLFYEANEDEEIHYVDFTSLYPYCNKYGTYPVGHPEILASKNMSTDINDYFGLIKCTIEPPKHLLHPVLPYRFNGKLMFPLCRTCVENQCQVSCTHSTDERTLDGSWVTTEVQKAVEMGYKITKKYINQYEEKEGIKLNPDKIEYNPGLRSLAKLMLNSFWGKFGQKENQSKTLYTNNPNDVYDLLSDPEVIVNDLNLINENLAELKYQNEEKSITVNKKVNVVIAAFTTATARLKLYELLEHLQDRVLYYDTDSCVFVTNKTNPDDWQPSLGDYLGELTNEIDLKDGKYISCFVSGGPKNYVYKLDSGKTVCKVKGLTLNFKNAKKVNFETDFKFK
ncbi:uncharacterized protein [Antedon mediterranea]|uniref:uncharacterized protein n=1 Tax=Antedon mediterranea TaxID=105859 RepID=UPI003AF93E8B